MRPERVGWIVLARYLVIEAGESWLAATNSLSEASFVAPYRLIGFAAWQPQHYVACMLAAAPCPLKELQQPSLYCRVLK